MKRLIDADKLIANIKRKIESIENCPLQLASFGEEKKSEGELIAYKDALSLIDSLQQEQHIIEEDWVEKRKQECGCRKLSSNGNYQCERYEGAFGPCDGRCSWIVDYPKLKELEAQEQPEVDLEKELEEYFSGWADSPDYGQALNSDGECVSTDEAIALARHFWNKGYNARKEK